MFGRGEFLDDRSKSHFAIFPPESVLLELEYLKSGFHKVSETRLDLSLLTFVEHRHLSSSEYVGGFVKHEETLASQQGMEMMMQFGKASSTHF